MENLQTAVMKSLTSLSHWIDREGPYGWDPYDALHSPWEQKLKNTYSRVFLIQVNKYSPLNLRPFLKVKKGIDLKGTALLTQAYAKMYQLTQDQLYLDKLKIGLEFIVSNSLRKNYRYHCWASHYYPYICIDKNRLENYLPDIIGTSQSIIALVEGYRILHDPKYLDTVISASHFLIDDLYQDNALFPYFKYTISEVAREIIPNASAQALEALSSALQIHDNSMIQKICRRTAHALIKIQRGDGSWMYSVYPNGKLKRTQLDFHQGYMIDGLLSFLPYSESKNNLTNCIKKGVWFYKNTLFRHDGRSYYRYPLPYPVDIHNQAQGIITFSKLKKYDESSLEITKSIAMWTVKHMQDKSGYFYFQKWPFITNKTPHMRWGQAWMMLALATILENYGGEL